MTLTKNFSKSEFNCKCGCVMPDAVLLNVQKVANQLQYLRRVIGQPIHINSGYRCAEHNAVVGGSVNSQHLLGKAADIVVNQLNSSYIYNLINTLIDCGEILQGGLGWYDHFTHYDIRRTKVRW